jgi:hypothetical protein
MPARGAAVPAAFLAGETPAPQELLELLSHGLKTDETRTESMFRLGFIHASDPWCNSSFSARQIPMPFLCRTIQSYDLLCSPMHFYAFLSTIYACSMRGFGTVLFKHTPFFRGKMRSHNSNDENSGDCGACKSATCLPAACSPGAQNASLEPKASLVHKLAIGGVPDRALTAF